MAVDRGPFRLFSAILILCLLALPRVAAAQGAVQQFGPVTAGHLPMWATGGLQMDAGGSPGAGLQPLNNNNPGTLPTGIGFVNSGLGDCQWTGYGGNAYSELCTGFDGSGNALFTVDRVGGGTPPTCNFNINGTLYPCAGSGGTVTSITATLPLVATPSPIIRTGVLSINTFASGTSGVVPASGGGTTNYLRADGTWAAPAGSGSVTSVGLSVPAASIFGVTGSPVTTAGTLGLTTSGTSGGIPYFSSTTTLSSSGLLTAHGMIVGEGAGSAPVAIAGGTGCVQVWGSSGTDPACSSTPTLGASGTLGSLTMGNATSGLLTLAPVTGALGTVTARLPANTGTIAELNLAQSWTAAQTFGTSDLLFLNSGGGATTLAGASSASNFTATFPANTGTVGELNLAQTWTGAQTFEQVYSTSTAQSGTTYTFAATDCGTEVIFTSGSAVTATIPASIVPAVGTNCYIAVNQSGAGKVSVNGSAVTPATLVSSHSYTGTSGTAGSEIALRLTTIGATATATLMGDGS